MHLFIIFLIIIVFVYGVLNFYVYRDIVNGLKLVGVYKSLTKFFIFVFAISFFVARIPIISRSSYIITLIGSSWLGILSIAVFVFVIKDISSLLFKSDKTLTLISLFLTLVLSIVSILKAHFGPVVKEVTIKTSKPISNKFTIVHLSDLHFNHLTSKKHLKKIVDIVNNLDGDIIAITGDLVDDNDFFLDKEKVEIFKKINTKNNVFVVVGNHEFYVGVEKFSSITEQLNFTLLRNRSISFNNEVEIVGIDDTSVRMFTTNQESNLDKLFSSINKNKFIILLSHQPDIFDKVIRYGIDLQLSGHTHLGQIPPMNFLTLLYFKYPYGLKKKNNSYIYTTSGSGTWGPPMRLFSNSEVVKITVEKQ